MPYGTSVSGCRTIHIAPAALLTILMASGCTTPPKPLALPLAILAVDYRPATEADASEQAPGQRAVELYAVSEAPTGTAAQLAAAAIVRDRGVPFRGKSRLPIGSCWLTGADVQTWISGKDGRKPSQQQQLGTTTAILAPTLATVIHETDDGSPLPTVTMQPAANGFRARLTSGGDNDPNLEVLHIREPVGPAEPAGLFVPDSRAGAGGVLLLLLPTEAPDAADLAAAHATAESKPRVAATPTGAPRSWQVVRQAVGERNRRPALLALVAPLGLNRISDLVMAADERALIAISNELGKLDPSNEQTDKNLAWLVEASSWRAVVPRAEREELSPALRAAFARHLGGVADDGSTLRLLLESCADGAAFERGMVEENLAALNDRSAAVRVRAAKWLAKRSVQVENYDPMASKGDRRAAVRRFLRTREAGQ